MAKYNYVLAPIVPNAKVEEINTGDFRTSSLSRSHIPVYSYQVGSPSVIHEGAEGYKLVPDNAHNLAAKKIGFSSMEYLVPAIPERAKMLLNAATGEFRFVPKSDFNFDDVTEVQVTFKDGRQSPMEFMEAVSQGKGHGADYYKNWLRGAKSRNGQAASAFGAVNTSSYDDDDMALTGLRAPFAGNVVKTAVQQQWPTITFRDLSCPFGSDC